MFKLSLIYGGCFHRGHCSDGWMDRGVLDSSVSITSYFIILLVVKECHNPNSNI